MRIFCCAMTLCLAAACDPTGSSTPATPTAPQPALPFVTASSPDGSWVVDHVDVEVNGVDYAAWENEFTCALVDAGQYLSSIDIGSDEFDGTLYSSVEEAWEGELVLDGDAWRLDLAWCELDCQGNDVELGGLGYLVVDGDELVVTRFAGATVDTVAMDECDLFTPFTQPSWVTTTDAVLRVTYRRN
jgi:hypothetical protein